MSYTVANLTITFRRKDKCRLTIQEMHTDLFRLVSTFMDVHTVHVDHGPQATLTFSGDTISTLFVIVKAIDSYVFANCEILDVEYHRVHQEERFVD